jgi:hypothetical protein
MITPRPWRGRARMALAVLMIAAAVLVAARLYLPHWAVSYVNRQINALNGYDGWVEDIDIALWRGAYRIHGLNIFKKEGGIKAPFVAAKTIDLSVEWRALFHGRVVAQGEIEGIDLNFAESQTGQGGGWGRFVDSLSPFDINRLAVRGGRVAFRNPAARPPVDVYIDGITGVVTNLRNVEKREAALPSDLEVAGVSLGKGACRIRGRVNIMRAVPDFDLDARLENAALPAFNAFARDTAAVDFASGRASVYSELAAADGRVTGYVKFLANDVAVLSPEVKHRNPLNVLWQGVVAAFMEIFKNHPKDQFALRVPVEGNINDPKKDAWAAFVSIFQNAFGHAFTRNTDGSVKFIDALRKAE